MYGVRPDYRFGYLSELCNDVYNLIYKYIVVCGVCRRYLPEGITYYPYNHCRCNFIYICWLCWERKFDRVKHCYKCSRSIEKEVYLISEYIKVYDKKRLLDTMEAAYTKCLRSCRTFTFRLFSGLVFEQLFSNSNTIYEVCLIIKHERCASLKYIRPKLKINDEILRMDRTLDCYKIYNDTIIDIIYG